MPKDLGKSRQAFNNCTVEKAYEVLNCWGSPFQQRDSLVNVSSGYKASELVESDLLKAFEKGESAMKSFIEDRIESSKVSFHSPIKKLNLKTFAYMTTRTTIKVNNKLVTLAAERSMFGRLLVIAKCESGISLRQVLQYSLSPIPWSLGLPDGTMVKTMKSKLLSKFLIIFILRINQIIDRQLQYRILIVETGHTHQAFTFRLSLFPCHAKVLKKYKMTIIFIIFSS